MHIVIVDTTLTTPPTGGAQTFLVHLAESLVKKHFRISIISQPGPEGSIIEALRKVGAEVHTDLWSLAHLPEEKAGRLAAWVKTSHAAAYIVSISPDVGWLALPLLDPSLVTLSIAHNDVSAFYEPLKHYHFFLDRAVGVSEAIRLRIVNDCGVPAERAIQIPYGVNALTAEQADTILLQPVDQSVLKICYLGRLVQEQKRVLEFVPLVAELRRRGINFELSLIGDGKERKMLEEQLRAQGLAQHVKFHGWLDTESVAALLVQQDVFILLSDHEGLPVALLEAMGHALVPVVTDIESGNTQLVHDGRNGFIVPIGDLNRTSDRIQQLDEDRDLLLKMKKAAWQTGDGFSVARMVAGYVACIREAQKNAGSELKGHSLPRPYPPMPSCRSKYPFWVRKVKARLLHIRSNNLPGFVA